MILKAYHRWGTASSSGSSACSPSRSPSATAGAWCWRAIAWASSRFTWRARPAGCALLRRCRRCSPRATSTRRIDRVALHHYLLPLGRAGAAHDPERRAQAAAGHRHRRRARRRASTRGLLAPAVRAARTADGRRRWRDALLAALRTAVERRMVADVPIGVLLSGGLDSSLLVALLAQEGQTGPDEPSASGSRQVGRTVRRRVRLLRPGRPKFATEPPADPDRQPAPAVRAGRRASRR